MWRAAVARSGSVAGRSTRSLGLMSERSQANMKVTRIGGIAVALMVAVWVIGIAVGQNDPTSWIGKVIHWPFGTSIYIAIVGALFTGIGAVCGALGRPFFTKDPDA